MTINKIISVFGCALVAMGIAASAQAVHRLPEQHNIQHDKLLANQRPVGIDIQKLKLNNFIADVSKREDLDNDIYSFNWNSPHVNAYSGVEIPAYKDIDVSDFVVPVPGMITSRYGYRPRFGRMHRGVDLRLSVGDTVVSAFDGKVRITQFERRGYGYYVVIRHDNGMETVYGHLSRFLVKPNQRVRAGEPIALGGNTGRSTGPHLHFETRYLGLAINPEAIIDFENKVTHKDIFTFDKTSYEKSQNYRPSGKGKYRASAHKSRSGSKVKSKASGAKKRTGTRKK